MHDTCVHVWARANSFQKIESCPTEQVEVILWLFLQFFVFLSELNCGWDFLSRFSLMPEIPRSKKCLSTANCIVGCHEPAYVSQTRPRWKTFQKLKDSQTLMEVWSFDYYQPCMHGFASWNECSILLTRSIWLNGASQKITRHLSS